MRKIHKLNVLKNPYFLPKTNLQKKKIPKLKYSFQKTYVQEKKVHKIFNIQIIRQQPVFHIKRIQAAINHYIKKVEKSGIQS